MLQAENTPGAGIWTVGHSTRPLPEFLALLAHYGIAAIADVRRFPGSRRHPQFGSEALRASLAEHDIAYHWFPSLGGRRKARPDSPNTAWRNAAFRGYADHIESEEFAGGMIEFAEFSAGVRTALMCAELLWWRCHRALISDVLLARGTSVVHIQDEQHSTVHPFTSAARIVNGRLTYAAPSDAQLSF